MNSNFVSKSRHYHGDSVPVQVTTTANHHYFEQLLFDAHNYCLKYDVKF